MRDVPVDMSFPHTYGLHVPVEVPQNPPLPRYFYPGGVASGADGILVVVSPAGRGEWLATFSFGHWFGRSGIYSLPGRPDEFLCVTEGVGYTVRASDPEDWGEVPALPIKSVLPVPDFELLVLGTETELHGFGPGSARWISPRLVWDELQIAGIDGSVIRGTGHDPLGSDVARWTFDCVRGDTTYVGGPPPPRR